MTTEDSIPVVDFKDVFSTSDLSTCPQVQQIHSAFAEVGFVFITNHGINKRQVDEVFNTSMDFFNLPLEVKHQYTEGDKIGGYVAMEKENAGKIESGDLKECFQVSCVESNIFPDDKVPNLKPVLLNFYKTGMVLCHKVMELMGHALKLKDPLFFVKSHEDPYHVDNFTTARVLYYPPLPSTMIFTPGQLRLKEHVDYSTITLLIQNQIGGLQVRRKDGGGYIDVPAMPEAVLINIGLLMQKWTSDIYYAPPHRVMLPEDEKTRQQSRQSIVLFVHPDHDLVVECVDGSGKYPPITAFEDTNSRFLGTYV